jgi:hypothetical protein
MSKHGHELGLCMNAWIVRTTGRPMAFTQPCDVRRLRAECWWAAAKVTTYAYSDMLASEASLQLRSANKEEVELNSTHLLP